jgi:cell division protein FtsW
MGRADRILLGIVLVLVIGGFFIFSSASLGLLAREGARFSSVAFSQILYGIVGGSIALYLASSIHYRIWRKPGFYIFLASLVLTLLVFVPGLSLEINGARRWLKIGFFSFQPSEFLKIGYVIYLSTWLSGMKRHIRSFTKGALPFFGIIALVGAVVLAQPDTDTFVVMTLAGVALFLTAGGRWRDILALGAAGLVLFAVLAFSRPYIMNRLTSFIDPSTDPQGASYQINQSLIAIGSGSVFGRGFGQSIQKFEHLPEPISDSIFAVYGEEFGFVGSVLLVLLFSFFAFRGYRIATESADLFGMLLVIGFVTLIVSQAFLNIAAMLALAPLSGLPLPFISQGGTALLAVLGSVGIILNVSKYRKKRSSVIR